MIHTISLRMLASIVGSIPTQKSQLYRDFWSKIFTAVVHLHKAFLCHSCTKDDARPRSCRDDTLSQSVAEGNFRFEASTMHRGKILCSRLKFLGEELDGCGDTVFHTGPA